MKLSRYVLPIVVLLMLASVAGCAATPEARWYQARDALNAANKAYLANLSHMSDQRIVTGGQLLQAARASLAQAKAKLSNPGAGQLPGEPDTTFDIALDVVESILKRLAQSPQANVVSTQPATTENTHESR